MTYLEKKCGITNEEAKKELIDILSMRDIYVDKFRPALTYALKLIERNKRKHDDIC